MLNFLPPFLGFLVGSLVFNRTLQWIFAIVIGVKEWRAGYGSPWAIPLYLLLHSGPWLLATTVFLAVEVFSKPHEPWWPWFFAGEAFAVTYLGFIVLRYTMKHRPGPNNSFKPKPLRGSA